MKLKLPILLISLLTFLVFASTLKFDFVSLDDYMHLHENPSVAQFGFEGFKKIWAKPYFGLYAPVTYTFWGAEFSITKLFSEASSPSPVLFHFSNILFHILNALLVYGLLLSLRFNKFAAAVGSLVFALHPVQVETVAWVSSFRDVLATFWGLLYLNLSLKYSKSAPRMTHELLLVALLALAILSKPAAVVFLGLGVLLLNFADFHLKKTDWYALIAKTLTVIACVAFAKNLQPDTSVDFIPNLWERVLLSLHSVSFYVQAIFWPAKLNPDYGLSTKYLTDLWQSEGLPVFKLIFAFVFIGVITWFSWRRKVWAQGAFLALVASLPYLGFVIFNYQNVSTVADRYLYAPMIGVAICAAYFFIQFKAQHFKQMRIIAVSLLILSLGLASQDLSLIWRSDETLSARMVEMNPRSFFGYNGLGRVLFKKGYVMEAEEMFKKSLDIRPSNHLARYNLATANQLLGKTKEALVHYIQVINKDPNYLPAYEGLAVLLANQGRIPEAKETVLQGLRIDPNSIVLKDLLAQISALKETR